MTECVEANFDDICRAAVESFLQTIVIVDNEASLISDESARASARARSAERKRATFPGGADEGSQRRDAQDKDAQALGGGGGENDIGGEESRDHRLELNEVSRAFAEHELTCGVYLPSEKYPEDIESLVDETVKAILPTDASVLDWELRESNSQPAIEAIKTVLDCDRQQGGRLRLILIYTAEELEGAASALERALRDSDVAMECFVVDGVPVLSGDHFRIAFANKPTRQRSADDPGVVDWHGLPKRIIDEFAVLSRGLLRAFALSSVAAVRRDMHRILAQFDEDLDPVYAGDRATKPDPDDAGRLMVEILESELTLSIEASRSAEHVLGAGGCLAWLESKRESLDDRGCKKKPIFWETGEGKSTKIDFVVRKRLLEEGSSDIDLRKSRFFRGDVTRSFFQGDQDDVWAARSRDYAVLATMAYHSEETPGRQVPSHPLLRFGTVISSGEQVLLCIQPVCDSVRLKSRTAFLFVLLVRDSKSFDLVLPDGSSHVDLQIPEKGDEKHLREIRTLWFEPEDGREVIMATTNEQRRYVFHDVTKGIEWKWRGQMREMTAIHLTQKAIRSIGRYGLNEFEWLRTSAQ